MKFAREYQEFLHKAEFPYDFPKQWINSAISYGQLKKCIKKVERELSSLGLDAETLKHLLQVVDGDQESGLGTKEGRSENVPFKYSLDGETGIVQPKLTLIVDTEDGMPVNAGLSESTRQYLQTLAFSQRVSQVRISEADDASSSSQGEHSKTPQNQDGTEDISQQETTLSSTTGFDSVPERPDQTGPIDTSKGHTIIRQRVEISLTSDSEFFQLLQTEMTNLEGLQDLEKDAMEDQINSISRSVAKVATPRSKSDLYRWREIFDLYSQAKIFFSTNEADRGSRNADAAAKQLQWFSNQLIKDGRQPKTKDGKIALEQFMWLNRVLLRNLQFQEINGLAMTKILKKFDKRTALGVKQTFPAMVIKRSHIPQTMAKAVSFQISEKLLTIIPQLNDYLCPVCFSISFKPIRLTCGHVFCIRCMITMQRAREDRCPLCRGAVVMQADSTNLDPALINFLKIYFPAEVKVKQKENERAATADKYGEGAAACNVM